MRLPTLRHLVYIRRSEQEIVKVFSRSTERTYGRGRERPETAGAPRLGHAWRLGSVQKAPCNTLDHALMR